VEYRTGDSHVLLDRSLKRDVLITFGDDVVERAFLIGSDVFIVVLGHGGDLRFSLYDSDGYHVQDWRLDALLQGHSEEAKAAAQYTLLGGSWISWRPGRSETENAPFDRDGKPFISILDEDAPRIRLIVPLAYTDGRRDEIAVVLEPDG
jgi:hypothetical protein